MLSNQPAIKKTSSFTNYLKLVYSNPIDFTFNIDSRIIYHVRIIAYAILSKFRLEMKALSS